MSLEFFEGGIAFLEQRLEWANLVEVTIVTTDRGPYLDDFFFVLKAADGSILEIPQEQAGEHLLPLLQRLPGFDNEAVIQASMSTDNASFPCWKKPAE